MTKEGWIFWSETPIANFQSIADFTIYFGPAWMQLRAVHAMVRPEPL